MDPMDTIERMANSDYFKNYKYKRPLIIGRIMDVAEDESVMTYLSDLSEHHYTEPFFRELVIKLYAMTNDFTILHGLTSTHAIHVLGPYFEDLNAVYKKHWIHLQLAYLSTGCTPLQRLPVIDENLTWETIFTKVRASEDVHIHKLGLSYVK